MVGSGDIGKKIELASKLLKDYEEVSYEVGQYIADKLTEILGFEVKFQLGNPEEGYECWTFVCDDKIWEKRNSDRERGKKYTYLNVVLVKNFPEFKNISFYLCSNVLVSEKEIEKILKFFVKENR